MSRPWIGVDLDRTLADASMVHDLLSIGRPVPAMVEKVKRAIAEGYEVRIFTARMSYPDPDMVTMIKLAIQQWCFEHIGVYLAVTNEKDFDCVEIWDDIAVQVEPNTGEFVGESQFV